MPPPPMVPGKHNMDIGTWDSPSKNGPALVPPPPPVITPTDPIEPSPLSQTKSNQSMNAAPLPPLAMGGPSSGGPPLNMHAHQRIGGGGPSGGSAGATGGGNVGSGNIGPPNRPAWSGPNNRGGGPHPGMMANIQNQRPNNMGQGTIFNIIQNVYIYLIID